MKRKRQDKILELINEYKIETQEELAGLLADAGFKSTQGTISRDIRELKVTKKTAENGKMYYESAGTKDVTISDKYKRMLSEGVVHVESAENIVVVKTVPGMAMAVAAAIDSIHITGLIGSIAGDDTIICVVKNKDLVNEVMREINGN